MGASGVPTNDPILIGISGLSLRLLKLPSRFTSYWFNTGSVCYYYQADEPPFRGLFGHLNRLECSIIEE